jgi:uncharacterized DUF497 family protein
VKFEWDPRKAASNLRKHGVAFAEAVTVFANPLARIHNDPDHAAREDREIIVGHSDRGQLLLVFFTERGEAIRIFSARRASKLERNDYEEGIS